MDTRSQSKRTSPDPMKDALDNLEVAFVAWGRAGANGDVSHPLREPWLRAREVLKAAGRLP